MHATVCATVTSHIFVLFRCYRTKNSKKKKKSLVDPMWDLKSKIKDLKWLEFIRVHYLFSFIDGKWVLMF